MSAFAIFALVIAVFYFRSNLRKTAKVIDHTLDSTLEVVDSAMSAGESVSKGNLKIWERASLNEIISESKKLDESGALSTEECKKLLGL